MDDNVMPNNNLRYVPGGSKNVSSDKMQFPDNGQSFSTKIQNYSKRSVQQFLEISLKYFHCLKNYSFHNI